MTKTAFILAAGKGTRLRPYTDNLPKPMVRVANKPIIGHIIDQCKKVGIRNVIINLFYLGEEITKYFRDETEIKITFSKEDEILETGGGVKNALNKIKEDYFFLINGDAFWVNSSSERTLETVINRWKSEEMDILLLLEPIDNMVLTQSIGDYDIDETGRAIRSKDKTGAYMFTGIRLTKKSIFYDAPDGSFSFLQLMDKAEAQGKLFGVIHKGNWHHISTPQDLENVNEAIDYDQGKTV